MVAMDIAKWTWVKTPYVQGYLLGVFGLMIPSAVEFWRLFRDPAREPGQIDEETIETIEWGYDRILLE